MSPEITYFQNGNIESEKYLVNGVLHREDGPAYISYYENGNKKTETYYVDGKYHRIDGPAHISYYENGNYELLLCCLNGYVDTKANNNGPSAIYYDEDGVKCIEKYHTPQPSIEEGVLHRIDGPAVIEYENGDIDTEMYYINGKLHREDGPAIVFSKNANNAIYGYDDEYYFNDKLISKSLKEYLEYVEKLKLLSYFE